MFLMTVWVALPGAAEARTFTSARELQVSCTSTWDNRAYYQMYAACRAFVIGVADTLAEVAPGRVCLPEHADREDVIKRLSSMDEIILVVGKEEACERFELPADRIGDIVVITGENMTIGTSEHRHDLAALNEPLRSHGGLTEQEVPFIVNRVMEDLPNAPELRNFDAFFYATKAATLQSNS